MTGPERLMPRTVEQMVDACARAIAGEHVEVVPTNRAMLDLCCRLLAVEAALELAPAISAARIIRDHRACSEYPERE